MEYEESSCNRGSHSAPHVDDCFSLRQPGWIDYAEHHRLLSLDQFHNSWPAGHLGGDPVQLGIADALNGGGAKLRRLRGLLDGQAALVQRIIPTSAVADRWFNLRIFAKSLISLKEIRKIHGLTRQRLGPLVSYGFRPNRPETV
ncbi:hypothetical protein [Blastochloris sulfoviridis]|uniref:hypothetical protein n=1 Tax=Blastochloris sulfoviridis TaxID=50712 RepID=UPI001231F60B|nr:hypothetical protein [Blastochloris sulfoviridis]